MANLSASLNRFSLKFFSQLSFGKNENLFISPYSISTALTMCYAAAKSETADELKALLDLAKAFDNDADLFNSINQFLVKLNNEISSDAMITLKTANKLYPKQGFNLNNDYVNLVTKSFLSEVQQLNYNNKEESSKAISDWVSAKTNNKINNLISSQDISPDIQLILINAIYFKGNWLNQFKKDKTSKEDFHVSDNETIKCDMMQLYGQKFQILSQNPFGLEADICELPYIGGNVSMTIILPNKGVKLSDIEHKLSESGDLLDKIVKSIGEPQGPNQKVNIHLPKFKLEYKNELSNSFKNLGASAPFSPKADFSGLVESGTNEGIYISSVIHQSFVEVNEEGTEAAAATAVTVMRRMAVIENIHHFHCDRPFIFLIHEKVNHSVLFIGKLVKP